MSRPLFRALTLDPNKRIRLLVDQHDDNNNDLTNPHPTSSASSNNLLVSYSSTSNLQTSQHSTVSNQRLPQRCVPQMPFVSGMEKEEEAEIHLQNALDAQQTLGSAKMRAVPIPDFYEDPHSRTIYPATVELPKHLIRLQPLQLESDDPDYDMDKVDHDWFETYARTSLPKLTHYEYETIIDKLENASTRILISSDEARSLLPSIDEIHLKSIYEFWYQRRTTKDKRLKLRLLTERDIKEEKGKQHPYVAFRRRVEKMTTRKNRKNDEQAYMSMLKLRSNFEAVVKLTKLIKAREANKASLLECALSIFQARCECKPDDDPLLLPSTTSNNVTSPIEQDRPNSSHQARSSLKPSLLMNSNHQLTTSQQQQQLLAKLLRLDNQKKASLSTSSLASLLQTPLQQTRTLSHDSNDSLQPKLKRFKGADSSISNVSSKKLMKKINHTDKLTQLLSSPTAPSPAIVHNLAFPPTLTSTPQSLLERLSPGTVFTAPPSQNANSQHGAAASKRRLKNSTSGTIKQGKNPQNLSQTDLWSSLSENLPGTAILLKAQFEASKRAQQQQKEDLENNANRRILLQDGSAVLSNSNENINITVDGEGTSIDEEELNDPWQFRPKAGCRYLRPIDQDQQHQHQHHPSARSAFSAYYYVTCSEQGHLGKRRVRIGRGGRLLYDRHVEQENKDFTSNSSFSSHITEKPILWRLSARPALKDSYRCHSHLTVDDQTKSLDLHYQSKSFSDTFQLNDEFYRHQHVNRSSSKPDHQTYTYPISSIELDHPYSCSSRRVHQALRTLAEPPPPSPSASPSPPLPLTSSHAIAPGQPMILLSTPPTPPPSTTSNQMDIDLFPHSQSHEGDSSHFYTKSSSTYILSPSTSFFPTRPHPYLISSTPSSNSSSSSASSVLISTPTSNTALPSGAATVPGGSPVGQPSSPMSCARVQFVQMHRIHPPSNPHPFASSTPVTTSDS